MQYEGADEDWIVADSDDESPELAQPLVSMEPVAQSSIQTDISSFDTLQHTIDPGNSSVSSFSNAGLKLPTDSPIASVSSPLAYPSTISNASDRQTPSLPRPRMVYKGPKAAPSGTVASLDSSSTGGDLPADTRPEVNLSTESVHEVPDLVEDFAIDIAERAKMRSRRAAKRSVFSSDIVEISSEDETVLLPSRSSSRLSPKTRPEPRARPTKRPKTSHVNKELPDTDPLAVPLTSSSPNLPPSDPPPTNTVTRSSRLSSSQQRGKSNELESDRSRHLPDISADLELDSIMMPPPVLPPFFADSSFSASGDSDRVPAELATIINEEDCDTSHELEDNVSKSAGFRKKSTVEVVIDPPTVSKRKSVGKGKGKGKSKVKASSESDGIVQDPEAARSRLGSTPKIAREAPSELSPLSNFEDDDELLLVPAKKMNSPEFDENEPKAKKRGKQKASIAKNSSASATKKKAGKGRIIVSDEEDVSENVGSVGHSLSKDGNQSTTADNAGDLPDTTENSSSKSSTKAKSKDPESAASLESKENIAPLPAINVSEPGNLSAPKASKEVTPGARTLIRRYTFSQPLKSTPMSELIRRVSAQPFSPFPPSSCGYVSPLAKSSKSMLRRIAPLHFNRRTPPPPPPPPPPPKKTKKMIELEEKWEMELEESVEGWWALSEEERKEWRRAKRDKELGVDD